MLRKQFHPAYGLWLILLGLCMAGCQNNLLQQAQHVYPDPARFEKAIAAFEAQDAQTAPACGAIVCVGSSSMAHWNSTIQEDLAPLTVIPRGFGGSTMLDLYTYVERVVLPYRPRAVVIYEGDNDAVAEGVTPEMVDALLGKVVRRIRQDNPQTRIYVLSTKPSPSRWNYWPKVAAANELMAQRCSHDPQMTYIDVATPMLAANGEPNKELFGPDMLHMNRNGYELWRSIVRPVLLAGEQSFEEPACCHVEP